VILTGRRVLLGGEQGLKICLLRRGHLEVQRDPGEPGGGIDPPGGGSAHREWVTRSG
jgi:hypothetical protein